MTRSSMIAVELGCDLRLRLVERAIAALGPDDVLVRVEWAGLCGSDLHVMAHGTWVDRWPAVLGHELCGVVETAGHDAGVAPGTRVVADSRVPCGACRACATARPERCERPAFVGEALPGGFASHCVLPAALVHPVPDGVDPAIAVLAEPLAVALHALGHVEAVPRRVLLLGHGPIGALVHVEARRRWPHAEILVSEPVALRRALARALGAEVADRGAGPATGDDFDLVVDAAGFDGSVAVAVDAAASGAEILVVALSDHTAALVPMRLAERRLRLVGCNAFVDELPEAIERLAAEGWRYRPIVTEAVTLAELPLVAERQLTHPDAVKVLVRP